MKNTKQIIEELPEILSNGKVDDSLIKETQEKLGVDFSEEYSDVLKHFGFLMYNGNRYLGISRNGKYDLLSATNEARLQDPDFPQNMYVISNMGIDGILLLQDSCGHIYSYKKQCSLIKLSDSFIDYLNS